MKMPYWEYSKSYIDRHFGLGKQKTTSKIHMHLSFKRIMCQLYFFTDGNYWYRVGWAACSIS